MAKIYSVGEITSEIKQILENSFGKISLEGEISNYRPSGAGHLYFTLKDEKASIQAVMFKGRSRSLSFIPKDGMTVIVEGSISLYEQRGSYQIILEKMSLAGEGDILKMLDERKKRLAEEGLFDLENKKPLPFFPKKIAVITSSTGAAVCDIINVSKRRNEKVGITVLPAVVQGSDSAEILVKQLKIADMHKLGDLIIIGRGGGSLEDLLPFSDESVVRAIYECETPVISAVGHEIDWAISDFVADMRAPTPSAAAELATPILSDIQYAIANSQDEICSAFESRIEKIRLILASFKPESLELRFRNILQPLLSSFDDMKESILFGMQNRLSEFRHKLSLINKTLEGANPQEILNRGYSIVRNIESKETVRSKKEAPKGALLEIQASKGQIKVRVE